MANDQEIPKKQEEVQEHGRDDAHVQAEHEDEHQISRVETARDEVAAGDENYHAIPRSGLDTHFEIPHSDLTPAPSYHPSNDPHGITCVVTPAEESASDTILVSSSDAGHHPSANTDTVSHVASSDTVPYIPNVGVSNPEAGVEAGSSAPARKTLTNEHLEEAGSHVSEEPLPPYSESLGTIDQSSSDLGTKAAVANDGRVNIRINQRTRRLSALLAPTLQAPAIEPGKEPPKPYIPPSLGGEPGTLPPPSMNVVIMVVGSRGDVQPFVALGKVLKETYGHRVRLATHSVFQQFIEENGLEFFSIGGDPAELMAFMVKNPGLMPGLESLRAGDVAKRRRGIAEIIRGCWRACYEAGDGLGVQVTDETVEEWMQTSYDSGSTMSEESRKAAKSKPFVADVIVANPPSFAHVHCAERLGIPVHIMFTMPWSPTKAFPHPLANIISSNADGAITNVFSYTLVEMLTWQGLGDLINRFRIHVLALEPISAFWAPSMMSRLRIPYTYCWSPTLIPKPADWPLHISIAGFYFLNLASNYTPAPDLAAFLEAGPPPVYIGFGSIVVDDPNAMTKMIFEAIKLTGQRALVSKGWGGLGADELGIPEGVFMLGNIPHDWLFHHVSCVVHHGGAGTTAAGIACGKPTVIVPFFGDQPFWGAMVARAGAGPPPIAYKDLTAEKLADQINFALKPESQERAKDMAAQISQENGNQKGAQSFHQFLPLDKMRCAIFPTKAAVWRVKRTKIKLSAVAAYTLFDKELLTWDDLKLVRAQEYETDLGPTDPISGGATATLGLLSSAAMAVADIPMESLKRMGIGIDVDPAEVKAVKAQRAQGSQSRRGSHHFQFHHRSSSSSQRSTDPKGKELQPKSASSSIVSPVTSPVTSTSISRVTSPDSASISDTLHSTISTNTDNTNTERASEDSNKSTIIAPTSSNDSASTPSMLSVPSQETITSPIEMDSPSQAHRGRSETESSMAEALRAVSQRGHSPWRTKSRDSFCPSRSNSPSRSQSDGHKRSVSRQDHSPSHQRDLSISSPSLINDHRADPLDTLYGTGKGLGRLIGAGLKSPMDITLAISKGFHNMPRLYGEEVRQVDRVTGLQSGLKTATKEFGIGVFEGVTGLVTQPIMGAKAEGVPGFFKGAAKGFAGLITKPGAATHALPAYAMLGIYKEIQKHLGENVSGYIIAARVAQGYGEWMGLGEDPRKEVVRRFMEKLSEVRGHRGLGGHGSVYVAKEGGLEKMKAWLDERRERRRVSKLQKAGKASEAKQKKLHKSSSTSGPSSSVPAGARPSIASAVETAREAQNRQSVDEEPHSDDEDQELEEAVRLSLRAHELGHGTPSFASTSSFTTRARSPSVLTEVPTSNTVDTTVEDDVQRAINASLEDLKLTHSAQSHDNEALARAVRESLLSHQEHQDQFGQRLQRAPTESLPPSYSTSVMSTGPTPTLSHQVTHETTDSLYADDEDEQLKLAIEESHRTSKEEEERAAKEEEIVLNFVKKQSLAEEEFRRQRTQESRS